MKPRKKLKQDDVKRYSRMFAAMGNEPRLLILRLLLSAHPKGMVVGDILAELDIASSTLSHHLEKLRHERLVTVERDRQFLWYRADTESLGDLLGFLYAECCLRSNAIRADQIVQILD